MLRVFEIIFIILILPLLAVPFIIVAALVWMQLGVPIFFSQTRMGRNGQAFVLYKFRTMNNVRDANGVLLPDEYRQTKLTKLLRRYRLDEMPQLLNILAGQMAIVGPRPLLPETVLQNSNEGKIRCRVRPGLTGWAQVSGNTLLTENEKLALDLWYVSNRNIKMDLSIILETMMVLVIGEHPNSARLAQAGASPDASGRRKV